MTYVDINNNSTRFLYQFKYCTVASTGIPIHLFFFKMSINPLFLGGDIIDLECVEQNTGKENLDRVVEQYIIDDDECENESVKEYTVEKVLEHRFKKVIHSFIYLFVVYYLFQNDLIVITFFRESCNIY